MCLLWDFSFGGEADMLFLDCQTCEVADGAKKPCYNNDKATEANHGGGSIILWF